MPRRLPPRKEARSAEGATGTKQEARSAPRVSPEASPRTGSGATGTKEAARSAPRVSPEASPRTGSGATGKVGDLLPPREDDRLPANSAAETMAGGAPAAEAETDVATSSVSSAQASGAAPARPGNSERTGPNEPALSPPVREGEPAAAGPESRETLTMGEMDKAAANETPPAAAGTATKPRSFPTEDLPIPRLVRAPDDPGPPPKAEPARRHRFWRF